MVKVILEIIGVIIGVVIGIMLIVGGIVILGISMVAIIEELMIINENIAVGVLGIMYGLVFSVLGSKIVQWIVRNGKN